MQSNAMKTQLMQQEAARDAQIRQLYTKPGFDPTSPQGIRDLSFYGGAELGLKALTAARQNENLQRQTQVSMADLALRNRDLITKHGENFQTSLRMIDSYPEEERPTKYAELIGQLPPELKTVYPGQYSPTAVARGMRTTTQLIDEAKPETTTLGGQVGLLNRSTGVFTPAAVRSPMGSPPPGVPSSPMRPAAAASLAARGQQLAPELMGGGAGAATGNALAPRQPTAPPPSPYGGVNALAPGGGVIPQEEFLAAQEAKNLVREADRAEIVKRAQMQGEKLEKLPKVQSSFVSAMAELQRQREAIVDLKSRPVGTYFSTGPILGRLPNLAPFDITGSGAAQARIDQVKSMAGLTALQELKQSSPTGASGLGGASDAEGRRLEASKAALSQTQGTPDFNKAVDTLDKDIEGAQKRLMDAYVRDYGDLPPDIQAQLPPTLAAKTPEKGKFENRARALNAPVTEGVKRIASKTEYDALPAGSVYVDPNGEQRTKR
jgi:hypothetical protein